MQEQHTIQCFKLLLIAFIIGDTTITEKVANSKPGGADTLLSHSPDESILWGGTSSRRDCAALLFRVEQTDTLRARLAYSKALKMGALRSSELLVNYQTAWRHIPHSYCTVRSSRSVVCHARHL
jgi:hypothetical protein